jgi:hypothetical protein
MPRFFGRSLLVISITSVKNSSSFYSFNLLEERKKFLGGGFVFTGEKQKTSNQSAKDFS